MANALLHAVQDTPPSLATAAMLAGYRNDIPSSEYTQMSLAPSSEPKIYKRPGSGLPVMLPSISQTNIKQHKSAKQFPLSTHCNKKASVGSIPSSSSSSSSSVSSETLRRCICSLRQRWPSLQDRHSVFPSAMDRKMRYAVRVTDLAALEIIDRPNGAACGGLHRS